MDLDAWCRWYERRGAGRLRHLLMHHWDPIGVAREPLARTEYDGRLGLVAERLRRGVSSDDLARLLQSFRTELMGLPPDFDADLRVAFVLQAWHGAEMDRAATTKMVPPK